MGMGMGIERFPYFTPALKRVESGAGNALILAIGDSATDGYPLTRVQSYPTALSDRVCGRGILANWDCFCGGGNGAGTEKRLVLGVGWGYSATVVSCGGRVYTAAEATEPMTFTPTQLSTGFRVTYIQSPGNGALVCDAGGGAAAAITVDCSGPDTVASTIIPAPSIGCNRLSITWGPGSTGGAVYIIAVEALDSTCSRVTVMNAGWGGSGPEEWVEDTGSPWDPMKTARWLQPDLVIISLGINPWSRSVPVNTFKSGMLALIQALDGVCDVVLLTPMPSAPSVAPESLQQAYVDAFYQLERYTGSVAATVDQFERFGSYEESAACGLYSDNQHGSQAGYGAGGRMVCRAILGASNPGHPGQIRLTP